jgi:hypothetical protein
VPVRSGAAAGIELQELERTAGQHPGERSAGRKYIAAGWFCGPRRGWRPADLRRRQSGIPHRTTQRWLARYRTAGLAGRAPGRTRRPGRPGFPEPLRLLVEGLALRTSVPSAAHVHREVTAVAEREGWPIPSYSWVYAIICGIDPVQRTLAVEGARRCAEVCICEGDEP